MDAEGLNFHDGANAIALTVICDTLEKPSENTASSQASVEETLLNNNVSSEGDGRTDRQD